MCAIAGVEVVHDRFVLLKGREPLAGRGNYAVGVGEIVHRNTGAIVGDRETGDGAFKAHAVRAGGPAAVVESRLRPTRAKGAAGRDVGSRLSVRRDELGDLDILPDPVGFVLKLLGKLV